MEEEIKGWIKQAESDLQKAKILFENKQYDGAAFYSQQTTEKSLKAVNLLRGLGLLRTHDLAILGRKVQLPKPLLEKAILLNPFYTSSRYPFVAEELDIFDEKTVKDLLNFAEEILKWCKQQIKI